METLLETTIFLRYIGKALVVSLQLSAVQSSFTLSKPEHNICLYKIRSLSMEVTSLGSCTSWAVVCEYPAQLYGDAQVGLLAANPFSSRRTTARPPRRQQCCAQSPVGITAVRTARSTPGLRWCLLSSWQGCWAVPALLASMGAALSPVLFLTTLLELAFRADVLLPRRLM